MKIIAYTYQADTHCVSCTVAAAKQNRKTQNRRANYDEHGVHDGFNAHPVFSTDETSAQLPIKSGGHDLVCGTCLTIITPHYDNNEEKYQ